MEQHTTNQVVDRVQPQVQRNTDGTPVICQHVQGEVCAWICAALAKTLPTGIGPIQHKQCPNKANTTAACEMRK